MSHCICPVCNGHEYLLKNEDDNSLIECWFCDGSGEWPPDYEYLKRKKKQKENYHGKKIQK